MVTLILFKSKVLLNITELKFILTKQVFNQLFKVSIAPYHFMCYATFRYRSFSLFWKDRQTMAFFWNCTFVFSKSCGFRTTWGWL